MLFSCNKACAIMSSHSFSFSGSLVRDKAGAMPVNRGMACFEVTTESFIAELTWDLSNESGILKWNYGRQLFTVGFALSCHLM